MTADATPTSSQRPALIGVAIVVGLAVLATIVAAVLNRDASPGAASTYETPDGYRDVDLGPITISVPADWPTKRLGHGAVFDCLVEDGPALYVLRPGEPVPCPAPPNGEASWPPPRGVLVWRGVDVALEEQLDARERVNGIAIVGSRFDGFRIAGNQDLVIDLTHVGTRATARTIYLSVRPSP